MVGRAPVDPERKADKLPGLPAFDRLAQPGSAGEVLAQIEAWTKPGEVVLDLNGRGGWVARAAVVAQRRAADFEAWPLTRLLAEVVLRPPDLRQIDAAVESIAGAALAGSTVRRTIDSLYVSACPTCDRPVTLDAVIWRPADAAGRRVPKGPRSAAMEAGHGAAAAAAVNVAADAGEAGGQAGVGRSRRRPAPGSKGAGAAELPSVALFPGQRFVAVAREFRCLACHEQSRGRELRSAPPTSGDVKLAASVPSGGEIREALRRRFPAPRPTHPLVDQLIDLHTARQLLGLHGILGRVDAEERPGATTAALRLAFLHAISIASRLNAGAGKPTSLRIANGSVRLPPARDWRERNPWEAFEEGLKLVRSFVQELGASTPRSAVARLGADLTALESGVANVTLVESTPAALRRLGLHGERMTHSGSPSRVRLVLGGPPLRLTPERVAALYHGTGWLFGPGAVSLLPWDSIFGPARGTGDVDEATDLATAVGRSLAIASPVLSHNGRAVLLLDDARPESLVAAALGGAAAGFRLVEARLHWSDDESPGIAAFVPPTGTLAPGPRTRANRPLPPLPGGAGDPATIPGRGVFAPPERLDAGPFVPGVAAQAVSDTVAELLKARGEPATFDNMLGELLIGLDRSGQLARLARSLRPPNADDGWSAWIDDATVSGPTAGPVAGGQGAEGGTSGVRAGAGPRARTGIELPRSGPAGGTPPGAGPQGEAPGSRSSRLSGGSGGDRGEPAMLEAGPVAGLLELIREELTRKNNRRIRQIEPGQFWLGSEEDRARSAQPLADRVEWATFSLLSSFGHFGERAALERVAALFPSPDIPDGELLEACLRSYASPSSRPDEVSGFEQLEARTANHDSVIAALAEVGHRLGMRVWIGRRQQLRRVAGRELSSQLDPDEREVHLPLIAWGPETELERVDCAWYVRRKATFLFEVEWTAMLGDPILVRHARFPVDDRVVRFLVIPPERAELVKFKLGRSAVLRAAVKERNWHFLKWNHLAAFAARPELSLDDLEPYIGLDAPADTQGEQLALFGG